MSCEPISVSLEVDPSPNQKIIFGLDKICNADDTVQWKIHFQLQEIVAPATTFSTIVDLTVAVTKQNHVKADATAQSNKLDASQVGAAEVAAHVTKDPNASDKLKNAALQSIVAAKQTPDQQSATS